MTLEPKAVDTSLHTTLGATAFEKVLAVPVGNILVAPVDVLEELPPLTAWNGLWL